MIKELTPKTRFLKGEINKLDLIKIEKFCSAIDPVKTMKRYTAD